MLSPETPTAVGSARAQPCFESIMSSIELVRLSTVYFVCMTKLNTYNVSYSTVVTWRSNTNEVIHVYSELCRLIYIFLLCHKQLFRYYTSIKIVPYSTVLYYWFFSCKK